MVMRMSQTKLIIYQLKVYTNDLDDNAKRKNTTFVAALAFPFDFRWSFDLPVNPAWLVD
jgi:hypothetical protein